jgi:hypothetical protein
MRFNCGLSHGQKIQAARAKRQAYVDALAKWHRVLILWPRRFFDNSTSPGTCVWLEYVWRRVDTSHSPECIGDWVNGWSGQFHPLEIGDIEWALDGEFRS